MIPYGRQVVDNADIRAVVDVLRSGWLTTGPKVSEFEAAVAGCVGAEHGVAVSSGTAALHCAMYALGIGPHDEVIVSPMTFVASANCVVFQGGVPVFADIEPDTLLVDPEAVEKRITSKTRAIIAVDYAGQPCGWDDLRDIAQRHKLFLVADGCHALGAEYKGRKVGSLADLTVFSFHPVKHITTGEGGLITTNNKELADKMRLFRNHGIDTDFRQREAHGSWQYEMQDLGFNYRITDMQCALGLAQLEKLPHFLERRRQIADSYHSAFSHLDKVHMQAVLEDRTHAYHLCVARITQYKDINRDVVFQRLRQKGIGVNVHYMPVHLHPYYMKRFGLGYGLCPIAEESYQEIISLPLWAGMTDDQTAFIIEETISLMR